MKLPRALVVAAGVLLSLAGTGCRREPAPVVAAAAPAQKPVRQMRVGTVDLQEVFHRFSKIVAAQEQINRERKEVIHQNESAKERIRRLERGRDRLIGELHADYLSEMNRADFTSQLERQEITLTDAKRLRRSTLDTQNKELEEKRVKEMRSLLQEIQAAIRAIADEEHYDIIIDRSADSIPAAIPSGPALLYHRKEADLTEAVIDRLNWQEKVEEQTAPQDSR
jgi:Skp family chaperone for outer membrane proteins